MISTEEEFRNLPGLRWLEDEDGMAKAVTIQRYLEKDHLYFHGTGVLGIYYKRGSKTATSHGRRWWKNRCHEVIEEFPDDFDGIIIFRPRTIEDIPKEFFISHRGNFSGKGWFSGADKAQEQASGGPHRLPDPLEAPEREKGALSRSKVVEDNEAPGGEF